MPQTPTKTALKRLTKEFENLCSKPDDWFRAHPDLNNDDMLTWYYVIRGSEDSVYEGGSYCGKIIMSPEYPFKPPAIYMFTPNGRFIVNMRLCMSFSDYHPETWSAGWTVRSIISGIQSFMMDESDPSTHGSMVATSAKRKQLAEESNPFNRKLDSYKEYFGDYDLFIRKKRKVKKEEKPAKKSK